MDITDEASLCFKLVHAYDYPQVNECANVLI